jgi:hypothetical protein
MMTEFMNGISINKVRPVGDFVTNQQKPPIPEVRKNGRRPASNYVHGGVKRTLNPNKVGLKDLLFKSENFGPRLRKGSKGVSSRDGF